MILWIVVVLLAAFNVWQWIKLRDLDEGFSDLHIKYQELQRPPL